MRHMGLNRNARQNTDFRSSIERKAKSGKTSYRQTATKANNLHMSANFSHLK